MSTIWLWSAGGILCLAILGVIPGVKEIIKPLLGIISTGVTEIFKLTGGYFLWIIKSILGAHVDLVRHLSKRKNHFNPHESMEDQTPSG